jgi:hypothetical protein
MVTEIDYWKNECLQSQLFFTRYFYKKRHGRKFVVNEHHHIICDALDKVLRGELTRLIINIAPRYSKTELAVKNFIARGLALNPAAKFIHLTYAAKLALDNSEESKDIVLDDEYQQLFPVQIKATSKAKDKWYTIGGGGVYAAASGGQVTGFGAGKVDDLDQQELDRVKEEQERQELAEQIDELDGYVKKIRGDKGDDLELMQKFGGAIIIDDPIKPEDAYSDVVRARINERFETTIRNRVNSRDTPIIVIQQRVHEMDLSGYLMDVEPEVWTVIKLPCLKEDGTALWPLKHTAEELRHINLINSFVFEAQYQQDPKPMRRGGEAYKLFTKERNVIENKEIAGVPQLYDPSIPIHLSFDFNVKPYMTCTIHQISGKKDIQIDEITLAHPRNRTEDVCQHFAAKYQKHQSGVFVYGDPNGKREDTRTEKGTNDYIIILRELNKFRPSLRVDDKAPPVAMRISWINAIFSVSFNGLEYFIGSNCVKTIEDYQFGKEDSDGTKLKEEVTDPITKVKYEKYHHITDANDYLLCRAFIADFALYQKGGLCGKTSYGKNAPTKHTF